MKVILVCSCSGMKERAKSAFKIMFPKEEVAPMYVGKDAIRKFASENEGTNISDYANATSKQGGKFAYYIEYTDYGDVANIVNLMNGKKVA